MTKYIYNGEGIGIPGLPHEVTQSEARALGVGDVLAAAIKRGAYKKVKPPRKPKAPERSLDDG